MNLFSGAGDNRIIQWNLQTKAAIKSFIGHSRQVSTLWVSGNTLYSGSWDGLIIQWDIENNVQINRFLGHTNHVRNIFRTGLKLYSASDDSSIKQWTVSSDTLTNCPEGMGISTDLQTCVNCPVDYYKSGILATSCIPCPVNSLNCTEYNFACSNGYVISPDLSSCILKETILITTIKSSFPSTISSMQNAIAIALSDSTILIAVIIVTLLVILSITILFYYNRKLQLIKKQRQEIELREKKKGNLICKRIIL